MSDNERMDRAKRIRRMREGLRDDEDAEESLGTDEVSDGDDEQSSVDATPGDADPEEEDGGAGRAAEEAEDAEGSPGEATVATKGTSTDMAEESPSDEVADEATADEADVDTADASIPGAVGGEDAGAELPDTEMMEAALEQAPDEAVAPEAGEEEAGGAAAGIAGDAVQSSQEADTRVLEFTLGDEQYGLDIEYIEEIVKQETITRVPNTADFVEGVVDLRGQITTILNPKVTIGKDDTSRGDLIVVFDSGAFDDQHIGWVVDDVRQVSPVHDEEVNDPPMEESYINGVIDRDGEDEFVIWTTPDLALEEADS
jgi:purine-binding chemotaxis protein CheW